MTTLTKTRTYTHQQGALATRFAREIADYLTPEQLEAANDRNACEDLDSGVCHTADFCDSNMAMAAAFEDEIGHEPDGGKEADAALWNAAWRLAKDHNFDAELLEAITETLA